MPSAPPPKRHPYAQWSPDSRALDVVGDKWTLLIVRDLTSGPRRFVELQRVLPGISTEQLRSRLNRMVADGLLTRQRYREVPPRVDYELTQRGRALVPVLAALARWGQDWAWGAPREREAINIGAIIRLAPGLLAPPPSLSATIAITVLHAQGGEDLHYTLTIAGGGVSVEEHPADDADVEMIGDRDAWVEALRPNGSVKRLQIDGDRGLALMLLDGLTASMTRSARAA